jgi:hypothetical protein
VVLAAAFASVGLGIGIALLSAVVAITAYRSRLGKPAPGADVLPATLADVREGGAIRLGGFGDDREDVTLTIAKSVRVRLGGEEWRELSGDYRGRTLTVEWRRRGSLLRVVAYRRTGEPLEAVALDPEALEQARAGGAPIAALASSYRVEEAGDAIREGATPEDSLAVKTWFLNDEEKRQVLRVERLGAEKPRVSQGVFVAADAVEIVRIK